MFLGRSNMSHNFVFRPFSYRDLYYVNSYTSGLLATFSRWFYLALGEVQLPLPVLSCNGLHGSKGPKLKKKSNLAYGGQTTHCPGIMCNTVLRGPNHNSFNEFERNLRSCDFMCIMCNTVLRGPNHYSFNEFERNLRSCDFSEHFP